MMQTTPGLWHYPDGFSEESLVKKQLLKYSDPEDRIFNRVISDISVVLRETILTISDSVETGSPVKTEMVKGVSFSTTEITEITRFKKPIFRVQLP